MRDRGRASGSGSSTRSRPRCGTARGGVDVHVEGEERAAPLQRGRSTARAATSATPTPRPALFSFNHPVGACATCKGFGRTMAIDPELVIPDPRRTLARRRDQAVPDELLQRVPGRSRALPEARGLAGGRAVGRAARGARRLVWDGEPGGRAGLAAKWYGVAGFFEWLESKTYKMHVRVLLSRYRSYRPCPDCGGARLQARGAAVPRRRAARCPRSRRCRWPRPSGRFREWDGCSRTPLDPASEQLLHEIRGRLRFLVDVGPRLPDARPPVAHALGRRGAARRRSPRRSAARSRARSTCSTSRRWACTRATPRGSTGVLRRLADAATRWWSSSTSARSSRGRPRDRPRPRAGPARAASSCTRGRSRGCSPSRARSPGALPRRAAREVDAPRERAGTPGPQARRSRGARRAREQPART